MWHCYTFDVSDYTFVVHQSRPVHIHKRHRLELTCILLVNVISLILNDSNKHNCIEVMKWGHVKVLINKLELNLDTTWTLFSKLTSIALYSRAA